jgi:hypothetical protein
MKALTLSLQESRAGFPPSCIKRYTSSQRLDETVLTIASETQSSELLSKEYPTKDGR